MSGGKRKLSRFDNFTTHDELKEFAVWSMLYLSRSTFEYHLAGSSFLVFAVQRTKCSSACSRARAGGS